MKTQIREFFPGGNTPYGFHSYYNYILPQKEAEKIICIKGGPGVGKSTLMKEIADHFSKKENIDLFRCSADPDSLDGVLISRRNVAVIDGTAPHIIDPVNPGAVDHIIDLGVFLDKSKLKANKEKILLCSNKISETYRIAYTYIRSASVFHNDLRNSLELYFDEYDMTELTVNISCFDTISKIGRLKKFFGTAISSKGLISCLPSITQHLNMIYVLDVPVGCDISWIMEYIAHRMVNKGLDVIKLYCPMDPLKKAEHIIIPEKGVGIVSYNDYHGGELLEKGNCVKVIKPKVYLKGSDDGSYKKSLSAVEENLDSAVNMLKQAKKLHDELESYYIESMDFNEMISIKKKIINDIEKTN